MFPCESPVRCRLVDITRCGAALRFPRWAKGPEAMPTVRRMFRPKASVRPVAVFAVSVGPVAIGVRRATDGPPVENAWDRTGLLKNPKILSGSGSVSLSGSRKAFDSDPDATCGPEANSRG